MVYQNIALLSGFLVFYSLFAGRFQSRLINGPLFYLLAGFLLGPGLLNLFTPSVSGQGIRLMAEFTLAIVLFNDAANANLAVLRAHNNLPLRLLGIGLPLTLLAGYGMARLLWPEWPWLEAALLATMLAPTDAALGKAVVSHPGVPAPLREGLNMESGLNDGICVPVLFLLLALLVPEERHQGTVALALELFAAEIGIATAIGIALALLTTALLQHARARAWSLPVWNALVMPGLALLAFSLAQWWGGSGFIAAFVAGLCTGHRLGPLKHDYLHSSESYGELLSIMVWVVFGAAVLVQTYPYISGESWLYAAASLTVLRMLPVWLALAGTGLNLEIRLFVGWFGPRGLASIVFATIILQETLTARSPLVTTVICTVLLSVVLHGITANPWVRRLQSRTPTSSLPDKEPAP